jgi:predicted phage terminase large subunit-like protein
VSRTKAGLYHVEDIRRVRATPASVEALVLQTAHLDGRGVPIYIEQEPGSAGKQTIATYTRLLAGYDVHGERSTGPKEEYIKPFSAQCEAGNVRLVKGAWIGAFLDEGEAWPLGAHDDQLDAVSKAAGHLTIKQPSRRIVTF